MLAVAPLAASHVLGQGPGIREPNPWRMLPGRVARCAPHIEGRRHVRGRRPLQCALPAGSRCRRWRAVSMALTAFGDAAGGQESCRGRGVRVVQCADVGWARQAPRLRNLYPFKRKSGSRVHMLPAQKAPPTIRRTAFTASAHRVRACRPAVCGVGHRVLTAIADEVAVARTTPLTSSSCPFRTSTCTSTCSTTFFSPRPCTPRAGPTSSPASRSP